MDLTWADGIWEGVRRDVSQNPLGEGEGRTDQAYGHMQRQAWGLGPWKESSRVVQRREPPREETDK